MRLIEELAKFPTVHKSFKDYMKATHNVEPEKYVATVPNANVIPQLINFIEFTYKVYFLDVLFYTRGNTLHEQLKYNDLVAKSIKVVFYMVENKKNLNFEVF